MKSNVIAIDYLGNGFENALQETRKVAIYEGLSKKDSLHFQLCTEEMLSLLQIVTGELKASFWIESEGREFRLHLSTKTSMDQEKRRTLIDASTSGKNEDARSFLGYLRDVFADALAASVDHSDSIPTDALDDLANHVIECTDTEWDGYEQSTLRRLADRINISIRGNEVNMTVIKTFA